MRPSELKSVDKTCCKNVTNCYFFIKEVKA